MHISKWQFIIFKRAFTLVEVLLAIAILGYITIVVVPSVLQNTQNKEFKQRWKQTYAQLATAYNSIRFEHGGSLSEYYGGNVNDALPLINDFASKLSIMKACLPYDTGSGAIQYNKLCNNSSVDIGTSDYYHTQDGVNKLPLNNTIQGQLIMNNGITLFFRLYNTQASLIWADMNGYENPPNILGVDVFGVIVQQDWIKPMGAQGTGSTINTCSPIPATCQSIQGFSTGPCAGVGCSSDYLRQ